MLSPTKAQIKGSCLIALILCLGLMAGESISQYANTGKVLLVNAILMPALYVVGALSAVLAIWWLYSFIISVVKRVLRVRWREWCPQEKAPDFRSGA